MLTRRQLRIKVMQALFYFQRQQHDDLKELEKFLNGSMTQTYTLFLYMAQLMVKLHEIAVDRHKTMQERHLASDMERNAQPIFAQNRILIQLRESEALVEALSKRNLSPWELNSKYVLNLYDKIVKSPSYVMYASLEESSVKKDLAFILEVYQEIIAPSDELMDYLEDINITWTDDYPLVNTNMIKFLRKVKPNKEVVLPELVKDPEDIKFALSLFKKSVLNQEELLDRINGKTPNWDKDRIAQIDRVLILMAQAEFLYFPSIPVKVTLNEYLEIAKDYSSPKSSTFINGIVDNLLKEFQENGQLNKMGRGLM
jgi:N utilization substance protein B